MYLKPSSDGMNHHQACLVIWAFELAKIVAKITHSYYFMLPASFKPFQGNALSKPCHFAIMREHDDKLAHTHTHLFIHANTFYVHTPVMITPCCYKCSSKTDLLIMLLDAKSHVFSVMLPHRLT